MNSKTTTRLSRLHAYPAMVEDGLAVELAQKYIAPGSRVLDPFCGSGRLLLAGASFPGQFLGVDVNPLACLVVRAKTVLVDLSTVRHIVENLELAKRSGIYQKIRWKECRKVDWYSETVTRELGQIVAWINSLGLDEPEKTVFAVALSSAARNASFCRNGRWKLHRMAESQRVTHIGSAWEAFDKALRYYVGAASSQPPVLGDVEVVCGQAQSVLGTLRSNRAPVQVDLVLTSPPYGDSKSTVQYGAASSLCLDVISQLDGLEKLYAPGAEIDSKCLGGRFTGREDFEVLDNIRRYWAGSRHSKRAKRVVRFLKDFEEVLYSMKSVLAPQGKMVLVLGRRSVGGFRVKMDIFASDCLLQTGFTVVSSERRKFHQKRMPKTINRYGRSGDSELRRKGTTKTMDEEIVLVLSRNG